MRARQSLRFEQRNCHARVQATRRATAAATVGASAGAASGSGSGGAAVSPAVERGATGARVVRTLDDFVVSARSASLNAPAALCTISGIAKKPMHVSDKQARIVDVKQRAVSCEPDTRWMCTR